MVQVPRCPHLPQDPFAISDDFGPDGAVGAWAPPPLRPGPQDLSGTAGRMEQRACSIQRQTDDTTIRPSGSGPDTSVRCTGLGARLLAMADEARAGFFYYSHGADSF